MKLHGPIKVSRPFAPTVVRFTDDPHNHMPEGCQVLLADDIDSSNLSPSVFFGHVFKRSPPTSYSAERITIVLPTELHYLSAGDIVRLDGDRQQLSVLYRKESIHNAFLLTERCNSYCVMCSQPPRDINDSHLVDELLTVIPLMSPDTKVCGFTGGEPTLLGNRLVELIQAMKDYLPETELQILSNGRYFRHIKLAQHVARTEHPNLLWAIPLYSDLADRHDFVVQASQAFDDTVRGILNLARCRQRVEIRMVIHRYTYDRLPQFAEYISRNFPFVDHVALMGLEMMGHVKMNLDALWIDPVDYQDKLSECVQILHRSEVPVSIYNHQLCVLDNALWPYAVRSISDWKNIYYDACDHCDVRRQCGGFFASAQLRYSRGIHPVIAEEHQLQ